ncbi:helix-turn-helix domain-containing protein [Pseudoflavonifractor capillosus]|uniref:helix-turn-helix domain-containing protein n=1 Tax=Pseudoflavonifractor capillosus TaxID=106588 RepID=UPI001958BD74|nr:helix-turn-helix transcriptional regulator [Pseudoflavonifractor capillosus]MBM6681985.1 helix-turn-helix transcriptional regulator [Pseudoflavonifractor capillosus]
MKLCERLSQMRKAHSFTQMELAEALGVSRQAVSKWEVGSSVLSTDNLIRLSQLYGITLAELLGDHNPIEDRASKETERSFPASSEVYAPVAHYAAFSARKLSVLILVFFLLLFLFAALYCFGPHQASLEQDHSVSLYEMEQDSVSDLVLEDGTV